ncbi:unnamed protein product [Rhodiola kirilowii]
MDVSEALGGNTLKRQHFTPKTSQWRFNRPGGKVTQIQSTGWMKTSDDTHSATLSWAAEQPSRPAENSSTSNQPAESGRGNASWRLVPTDRLRSPCPANQPIDWLSVQNSGLVS